jgi:hypothetical protein
VYAYRNSFGWGKRKPAVQLNSNPIKSHSVALCNSILVLVYWLQQKQLPVLLVQLGNAPESGRTRSTYSQAVIMRATATLTAENATHCRSYHSASPIRPFQFEPHRPASRIRRMSPISLVAQCIWL